MNKLPVRYKPPCGVPQPHELTAADICAMYLVHAERDLGAETYKNLRDVLRMFVADLGGLRVAEAKPYHLRLWVQKQTTWRSNWTKRRGIASVRGAFGWAVKMGFIEDNPFRGVSNPQGERGEPIEPAEFQAMLRNSTAVFRRVLVFMRFTGCRPGEMAKSEWKHLDIDRQCITLTKHKTAKSTGKPRRIMLHPVAMKLVAWIARNNPHHRLVFVNSKRTPWTNTAICWRIKQARKAAGVRPDVTLYHCRHGWITQAVLSRLDIAVIAQLAGHARIETTMTYVHLYGKTDHLQAAVAAVSFSH